MEIKFKFCFNYLELCQDAVFRWQWVLDYFCRLTGWVRVAFMSPSNNKSEFQR